MWIPPEKGTVTPASGDHWSDRFCDTWEFPVPPSFETQDRGLLQSTSCATKVLLATVASVLTKRSLSSSEVIHQTYCPVTGGTKRPLSRSAKLSPCSLGDSNTGKANDTSGGVASKLPA